MAAAAREQQTMAMLTGYGGPLGSLGNVGAQVPFIAFLQRQQRYRGLTPENLGEYIRNPAELTAAVGQWEAATWDAVGLANQRTISEMLVPRLYNMWMAQRVEYIINRANRELTAAVRSTLAQTQGQEGCRAPPSVIAPVPQRGRLYSGVADPPVAFEWDTRTRIFGIGCFGGAEHSVYTDHYSLNGRYVGTDRREYDRVRAPLVASGAQFCGAWETRREEMRK